MRIDGWSKKLTPPWFSAESDERIVRMVTNFNDDKIDAISESPESQGTRQYFLGHVGAS